MGHNQDLGAMRLRCYPALLWSNVTGNTIQRDRATGHIYVSYDDRWSLDRYENVNVNSPVCGSGADTIVPSHVFHCLTLSVWRKL